MEPGSICLAGEPGTAGPVWSRERPLNWPWVAEGSMARAWKEKHSHSIV